MSNKHFVPTEEGLALAEEIARLINKPFNKEFTRQHSIELLDLFFADISSVLVSETRGITFQNFASRDFAAYINPSNGKPLIYLDQQFQFFLQSCTFINCILACNVLSNEEEGELASIFQGSLKTFREPLYHETQRGHERPLLLRYVRELQLANSLTDCMIAFILCHEIAHWNLGHQAKDQSEELEYEADELGFLYLVELTKHFETLPNLKIAPNKLCAPAFSFLYLGQALSALTGIKPSTLKFLKRREEKLNALMEKFADEEAIYLYRGFTQTLEGM